MKEKILADLVPTAIRCEVSEKEIVTSFARLKDKDGNPSTVENAIEGEIVRMSIPPKHLRFFVDNLISVGREYEKTHNQSIGFSLEGEEMQNESNEDAEN